MHTSRDTSWKKQPGKYSHSVIQMPTDRGATHTQAYAHCWCTGTITPKHRLAPKPSRLTSSVGLIGSYLVSIELCACLQYAELNSHSEPQSTSLCAYERKTRGRGREWGSEADMKTTMWSCFASAGEQTPHRGCDHNTMENTFICMCVYVNGFFLFRFTLGRNLRMKRWQCYSPWKCNALLIITGIFHVTTDTWCQPMRKILLYCINTRDSLNTSNVKWLFNGTALHFTCRILIVT